jgi:DNA-binding transcriptional ArsR family regulator
MLRRISILNQMVKYHGVRLSGTFGALADPTRRAILRRLAAGEASISELAEPYEMSLPAISKHLRVMEDAGLVTRRKEGRSWRCRLVAAPLKEAVDFLSFYQRFWSGQLDSVADYLKELDSEDNNSAAPAAARTRRGGRK